MVWRFILEEDGVTAIEYSLIGVLITVASINAMDRMGRELGDSIYIVMGVISAAV